MLPRPAATREADGSAASSATSPVATPPGPPQTLADLLADPSAEVERRIWDAVRSEPAVHFITGPAGTGKSHLLRLLADAIPEGLVLLAPTGISAVNVRGQTLHRFFRLEKGVQSTAHDGVDRPTDLYRAISTLIIDEVSMVRADVLDKIDAILRRSRRPDLPFGGIRVIAVGDSLQLPPVVTKEEGPLLQRLGYQGPYFFDAHVAQVADMRVFLLSRIHRQREKKFVDLLSAVRVGQVTPEKLEFLNRRVVPEAVANAAGSSVVTTRRWRAEMRNEQQLQALPTPEQLYEGRVEGLFPSNQLPVPRRLALRPGARVLFVKNDADNRWVNGTAGIVSACHPDRIIVDCAERCGPLVVHPVGWERYGYAFDPKSGGVHKTVTGRFVQVPLILGWAATVHRCQGLTLNRTHVDLSPGVFSPGQAYVALSRCRTLGGLTLERPVRERDIIIDPRVIRFLESQLTHRAA